MATPPTSPTTPSETPPNPTLSVEQLRENYRRVTERVAEAAIRSGRQPADVVLVAVTKFASPDQIRTLVELGHRDLGENKVQQLAQRVAQLNEFLARKRTWSNDAGDDVTDTTDVRWHMIGHMQRNKVKQALPLVRLVHSVDSLRLAEEIHALGAKFDAPQEILLQVNISGEETKSGIAPPAALHMAEQIDSMVNLRLRGLMTMAPIVDDPEQTRSVFQRCRELFEDIKKANIGGKTFNVLSMGMTDDFEIAIEEGANIVRVGRAIFGDSTPTEKSD